MEPASELTITPLFPARLPKGTELAGHVVDGWLRDGGMAAIYRAHREPDGARMALKLQLPSTTRSAEICQRFDREAEAMRRVVGEPHVVELHQAGVLDDGRRYFVMEWVEGDNLEELLDSLRNDDKRLSVTDVCELGLDLAKGLAALHEHGLVHRDLKPSNVMVGRDEADELIVKLVDFGIVADLRAEPSGTQESGHADEAVMGTSAYMAPEQVAGHPPTPAVDVFALGVVLYEALTGSCVPPDGWTPETLPTIDSLRRNVPPELVALVRTCMSSEAQQRPASGSEVVARLAEIFRKLQAAGAQRVSSEEVPIRTGGTMVTPRAQLTALDEPAVRTGGTEVALTHEQVLTISTSVPRLKAVASPKESSRDSGPLPATTPSRMTVRTPVVASASEPASASASASLPIPSPSSARASSPVPAAARRPTPLPVPTSMPASASAASLVREDAPDDRPKRRWVPALVVLALVGVGAAWMAMRSIGGDESAPEGESTVSQPTAVPASPMPALGGKAAAPEPALEPPQPSQPLEAEGDADADADADADEEPAKLPSERDRVVSPSEASAADATEVVAKARPKGPDKAACDKRRSDAMAAKMRRDWVGVLTTTSVAACWTGATQKLERRRLRVEAYAETGNFGRCVKEGGSSPDSQIGARVKWCTKKLGS